jgi:hypothetical protein
MRVELEFEREKVTKAKVRFAELGPRVDYGKRPRAVMAKAAVGWLYVSQSALEKMGDPDRLKVTLEDLQ